MPGLQYLCRSRRGGWLGVTAYQSQHVTTNTSQKGNPGGNGHITRDWRRDEVGNDAGGRLVKV